MNPPARGRRPGASTARGDILAAARELFAENGYERASMRAIARRAGVDPALISHFFGSKEGLLEAALTPPIDPGQVIGAALADVAPTRLGEQLVLTIVLVWDSPAVNPTITSMLRAAASHDLAMTYLRQTLQRTTIAAISGLVDDDTAQLRAELVVTQMAGLAFSRYLLKLPQITGMTPQEVARTVGGSVQHYLTDPL